MSDLETRLREQLADLAATVTIDSGKRAPDRRRTQRMTSVVIGALALALAAGIVWVRWDTTTAKPANTHPVTSLPTVRSTDASVRSLWQLDGLYMPNVVGDQVVGFFDIAKHSVVRAVAARDGSTRWTYALPATDRDALGLVATPRVVVAVAGRPSGRPAQSSIARRMLVIDAHTGKLLWSQAIGGFTATPPIAVTADLVVTGDEWGTLNARDTRTGVRAWRRGRPASCARARVVQWDERVVADGSLLAASYQCSTASTHRAVVQRLDPANGSPRWEWATPQLPGPLGGALSVVGAAARGNVVAVAGSLPADNGLGATLGRVADRSRALGSSGDDTIVALDAATGRPRWNQFGSGLSDFEQLTLVDGAVCESTVAGFACQDDVTGHPTRPPFISGYHVPTPDDPGVIAPIANDRSAGFGNGSAAAVSGTGTDSVSVSVVPIRATGPVVKVTIGVRPRTVDGADGGTFVVGRGDLPGGMSVVLLRRIDVRGYPILAIGVTPHR